MARRLIKLTEVRKLAKLKCTKSEAAAELGISLRRFNQLMKEDDRVLRAWEEGQEQGKVSLRRKQFLLAGQSAPMAIHLGKQYLGQDETIKHQHTGADGGPIEMLDVSKLNASERRELRRILTKATTEGSG